MGDPSDNAERGLTAQQASIDGLYAGRPTGAVGQSSGKFGNHYLFRIAGDASENREALSPRMKHR